jgi:hypothetical protein
MFNPFLFQQNQMLKLLFLKYKCSILVTSMSVIKTIVMKQKLPCIVCIIVLALILFITDASAQRYHSNRGNGRGYNNYYSYNYRPSRPYIAVNIGRYNNYRQPYYSRPVYRSRSYMHFGPSFGIRVNVLPVGYYPFYIGSNSYYYNDGIYYRPYNGGYEVIQAPLGATVKHLPSGTKVTVIDGQKYYELGGTYYQEEINEKNQLRYKVVGTDGVLNTSEAGTTNDNITATVPDKATTPAKILPETGARFDKLPEGSKTVVIKKEKYYLSPDGVYYQEVIDGDNIRYEVTGNSAAE